MTIGELADGKVVLVLLAAFLCGGFVKGTIGIGLPLIAMPILSIAFNVRDAIALTVVPVLISNIWQALAGGHLVASLRRFGPLIFTMTVMIFVSAKLLHIISVEWLDVVLGLGLMAMVFMLWGMPRIVLSPRRESVMSAGVGVLAGAIGGLTSLSGMPVIIYLMALQLPKDEFVRSIAVVYLFGGLALAVALAHYDVLGLAEGAVSSVAVLPMLAGMIVGQKMRDRLDQAMFKKAVLITVAVVALMLLQRGFVQL